MSGTSRLIGALLFIGMLIGCTGNQVERTIKKELASGVRYDSLFLGVHFKMSKQEFFDHCWEINRKGLVKEGPENMSVFYQFDHGGYNVDFNFYPEEKNGITSKYKCSFSYEAWAPWNRQLQSDSLMLEVPEILMQWYPGNEFIHQEREGKAFLYKIDGNRMIEIYVIDERKVAAIFTDLTAFVDI